MITIYNKKDLSLTQLPLERGRSRDSPGKPHVQINNLDNRYTVLERQRQQQQQHEMQSTPVVNLNHSLGHQTSLEVQNIQEVTQTYTTPQLDRAVFTSLFRIHNQTALDKTELQFNGRPIDLFVLYSEVTTLGGITNVRFLILTLRQMNDNTVIGSATRYVGCRHKKDEP